MTFDELLDAFDGVKRAGSGYVAVCPAHEDHEASLGISEGDDGRVLLKCYAGCETLDVLAAMGWTWKDLPAPEGMSQGRADPEAIYPYTDELGNVLFEALRFPGKRFKQRHLDPEDERADERGYVWNLDGVRRVLFRLPEITIAAREGDTIYIVEGEKDALRLWQEGHAATCNPGGAGKWRDEYTATLAALKPAKIVIIQDRDEPGRRHAQRVSEALKAAGLTVFVGQPKVGKDAYDHFAAGLSILDLQKPKTAAYKGIVTAAEMAEHGREYLTEPDPKGWYLLPGVEGSIIRPGRMYAGGAYTGDGKTTVALQGARSIASQDVRVGYYSLEMPEKDLRNRLVSHRGIPLWKLEQPSRMSAQTRLLYAEAMDEMQSWQLDLTFNSTITAEEIVRTAIDREQDVVFIDHIHRFRKSDRMALENQVQDLTNLALDYNVAVVVLCQLRRFQRGQNMVAYPPPILQDFRETEMIGNEASIAWAIWRSRDAEGLRYVGDNSQFRVLKNRHTTSRHDQAGKINELQFDRDTQLFSPALMLEPVTQQAVVEEDDPEEDVWAQ